MSEPVEIMGVAVVAACNHWPADYLLPLKKGQSVVCLACGHVAGGSGAPLVTLS